AHATDLAASALGHNVVALVANDGSLALVRAQTQQLIFDGDICKDDHPAYASVSVALAYFCDGNTRLYVGRKQIAVYPGGEPEIMIALEPKSGRAAVVGRAGIHVYDADAKVIAKAPQEGAITFEDADHLYVLQDHVRLSRWTIGTDTWEDITKVEDAYSI